MAVDRLEAVARQSFLEKGGRRTLALASPAPIRHHRWRCESFEWPQLRSIDHVCRCARLPRRTSARTSPKPSTSTRRSSPTAKATQHLHPGRRLHHDLAHGHACLHPVRRTRHRYIQPEGLQDFFVDLDLPVTLTQGDRVSIPVAVYNYSGKPGNVTLKLQPDEWYYARQRPRRKDRLRRIRPRRRLAVHLNANRIGKFKLTLSAQMKGAGARPAKTSSSARSR